MADTSNLTEFLKDIATAIKDKKGTTEPILAANFDIEIKTIDSGVDTSDATAAEIDMVSGKTAYVNGEKITGIIPEVNAPDSQDGILTTFLDYTEHEPNTALVQIATNSDVFLHAGGKVGATVPYDIIATEFEITSDKIVSGNTILGVEGAGGEIGETSGEGVDTSDATATASDIAWEKTAYVNGEKVTGTVEVVEAFYNKEGSLATIMDYSDYEPSTVLIQIKAKDDCIVRKDGKFEVHIPYDTLTAEFGITPDKIVSGNTILGVEGTGEN